MSPDPSLYPEKGDRLFKGDWDIDLNADISTWNKNLHSYAEGYRKAADIIVQTATRDPMTLSSEVSLLIFPVVFLYRQYLELRLKEIILLGSSLSSKPQGFPKHHRIAELWQHAKPYLKQVNSGDSIDAVGDCIAELDSQDPDGSAFRYPMNLKGESNFQHWIVINLRHFGKTITKIGNLLDESTDTLYLRVQQMKECYEEP